MFNGINNVVRQRLINLMYLVFITLAFIYLPSDFVDTTKYARNSFEISSSEYKTLIDNQNSLLNEQLYINTPLAQDYTNVMDILATIDTSVASIDKMILAVETKAGGYSQYNYLYNSKNFLISNKLLVINGQAELLRKNIESIKQKVKAYNLLGVVYFIDSILPSTSTIVSSNGKSKTWESFFFSKTPVGVMVATLVKIKTDLIYTKLKLGEYLVNNISSSQSDKSISILTSNSIAVEVLAAKTFVLGEKVAFRVILLDSARRFENVKTFLKQGGKVIKQFSVDENGMVSFHANQSGSFQLVVQDSGNVSVQNFFVSNLRTAQAEKSSFDILYMGIDNPIHIEASGIDKTSLQIEIDMGEVIPFNNNYFLRFKREGLARLKVYSTNKDGRYMVVSKTFEVKKLPTPIVLIDGKQGGNISSKILAVKTKLEITAPGLAETANLYDIVGFDVVRVHSTGKETATNRGNSFSGDAHRILRSTKTGDLVIIENIRIKATDGTLKETAPLVFRIK